VHDGYLSGNQVKVKYYIRFAFRPDWQVAAEASHGIRRAAWLGYRWTTLAPASQWTRLATPSYHFQA
jgi:hypothetical protein